VNISTVNLKVSIKHIFSLFRRYIRMLFDAGSLIITMTLSAGVGFLYWIVAARYYPPESVGLGTAAISSMLLLAEVGQFGLTTMLVGQLSRKTHKASTLISTVLVVIIITSGIPAIFFGLIAPMLSSELGPISSSFGNLMLYSLGVVAISSGLVLDYATIGLERGELQLWRNFMFSVAKLVALVGAAFLTSLRSGMTIYGTWVVSALFSLAISLIYSISKGFKISELIPDFTLHKELRGLALGHYALNLAAQAPGMIMPILITILLSLSVTASFYIAWMITSFIQFVPTALSITLYAAAAKYPETGLPRMRFSLLLSFALGVVANIAMFFLAGPILSVFGEVYVLQAEQVLKILVLSVFPYTILVHFVAKARINETANKAAPVVWLGAILQLGFASIGAKLFGTVGFSVGWLIGLSVLALLIAPNVVKTIVFPQSNSNPATSRTRGEGWLS
jgi:O-antigen/teichoic acid export membrane protein